MRFTDLFIKRPVLSIVISILLLILGLRAIYFLELRQFPKMQNTNISITTAYPGANANTMQGFITTPIERAVASADGIDYLTSQSTDSVSVITANIRLNYDPNVAMTDIMSKVAQISNQLPKESKQPVILKQTGSQFALMYLGFSSNDMSTVQITDYLIREVQPKLQTVAGVANAEILGGKTYAMRIWLDTQKMAALHITPLEVANALQQQNYQAAAGSIKSNNMTFVLVANTQLTTPQQFNQLIIREQNHAFIRIKDIGKAEYGPNNYDSSVKFNGKNGVFIGIQSTPTANPLTVIQDVKAILPSLKVNYPTSLESKVVYDSTRYIRNSIAEVRMSLLEATLIVILVIFAFIGTWRAVFIPIITIPLSLIGVCALMLMMGYSINLLTLLAMVLAIGLVVDDAIVVLENIYRHLETGMSPHDAAILGAREIVLPVITMTITLACVYAPIGFMTGLTGALFKEFAFTLSFAVLLSGILALVLSPMMCAKLLSPDMLSQPLVQKIDRTLASLKQRYQLRLQRTLSQPKVMVVFAMLTFIFCILLALTTRTELAPQEDQSILFLSLTSPKSTNLNYLEHYTDQLTNLFQSIAETNDFFVVNGMGATNNAISGYVLKPWDQRKRSQAQVLASLQPKISQLAGVSAVAFPLPSLPGNSGGLPVQFVITTTADEKLLYDVMQQLQTKAQQSGLFMFVDSDLKFQKPVIEMNIDHAKAASVGISMEQIGQSLSVLLGGNYINRFDIAGQSYEVIPQAQFANRYQPDDLNYYYLQNANGENIPLGSLIQLRYNTQANILYHFQQLHSATLSGLMLPGRSITEGLQYLQQQATTMLPNGFSIDYAGQSRQLIQEGNTLIYTFIFALGIIYLVLAAQFESFIDPLIILISVPLSMVGALLPLQLGLASLNIYTGIGLVTLIGLISKHGILMVDFANHLRLSEHLSKADAIILAASLRLRPILMTTIAMVLGVLPLIVASGAGSASRFNIGLVIASGMLVGTSFTLFVVPSMYMVLSKR